MALANTTRRTLLGVLALTLIFTIPRAVSAQDDVIGGPHDWSSFYVGINAGAAFLSDDISVASAVALSAFAFDEDDANFAAGGQAGWNMQFDNLLVGIEGDFNYLGVESDVNFASVFASGNFANADYDWLATIRGRVGFPVGEALFYATGGVAFTELEVRSRVASAGQFNSAKDSKLLVGWTLGAGVEYMVATDWTAKLEYLYADFGSRTFNGSPNAPATTFKFNPDLHLVRVGVNYQF